MIFFILFNNEDSMTNYTISELLTYLKIAKERINNLKHIQESVSKKETYFRQAGEDKVIEPQYDPKLVDRKIVQLQKFILITENSIKHSNAITNVNMEIIDIDSLLTLE